MARANDSVEAMLLEFADLLSIVSTDPFKPRAYEKAARSVGGYHADLSELDEKGILAIPNVGRSIADKIVQHLRSGAVPELEELRSKIPGGVREMTAIPGFGPKKAMQVYQELGIDDVDDLVAAAQDGTLAALKGFSKKTEDNIIAGVRRVQEEGGRVQVNVALELAELLLERLRAIPQVRRAAYAGSLRRMRETIGDVDLLVASDEPGNVME
ncbi:MAG: helix-hairpin-helix domain-containing protein, partial [Actinomycetota bacterium]